MTVQEWREQHPDTSYTMVWAANAHSFGPAGGSVYGSKEATARMQVVSVETQRLSFPEPHDFPVLHVWDPIICDPLPEGTQAGG